MTPPLISFIVPAFNTERYILETLNSLNIEDENHPIEVVVINDGSSDDTYSVVETWIQSSAKVNVIHLKQENKGLAITRNIGVHHASGQYLAFCDSDDFVRVETFIRMARLASKERLDLVFGRASSFSDSHSLHSDFNDFHYYNTILGSRSYCITSKHSNPELFALEPSAATKLYSRNFYLQNKISFPESIHFEDLAHHSTIISKAQQVGLIDETCYFYRVGRPGKITEQRSDRRFDVIRSARIAIEVAETNDCTDIQKAYLLTMLARMIYWCGEHVNNSRRTEFFVEACRIFSERSERRRLVKNYARRTTRDKREARTLNYLSAGRAQALVRIAAGLRPSGMERLLLAAQGYRAT